MKTRNGFISNSSTSSFVIVGFLTNKKELTTSVMQNILIELDTPVTNPDFDEDFFCDALYDVDIKFIDNSESGGFDDGRLIIGCTVTEMSDDGCEPTEFHDIEEDFKFMKKLASFFADEPRVQLITGTRMS
jgi:hypothetical protein